MSYADRLKAQIAGKGGGDPTYKTIKTPSDGAKPGFVGFVGSPPGLPANAPRRANDREGGDIHLGMTRLWRNELSHPDWPEALQLALNNADAALDSLRAGGWL